MPDFISVNEITMEAFSRILVTPAEISLSPDIEDQNLPTVDTYESEYSQIERRIRCNWHGLT